MSAQRHPWIELARRGIKQPVRSLRYMPMLLTAEGRAELQSHFPREGFVSGGIQPFHEPFPRLLPPKVIDDGSGAERFTVLLPAVRPESMSGGPNTAILLGGWLARHGATLRLASCDIPPTGDAEVIAHARNLAENPELAVEVLDWSDRRQPFALSSNERLIATMWTTAWVCQGAMRAAAADRGPVAPFLYLVQDFEPGLYQWGEEFARAWATYDMDMRAIVNEPLLIDYLRREAAGRFADDDWVRDRAIAFTPAVDRARFRPDTTKSGRAKRSLLFYARARAPRNLYQLGLSALNDAVEAGAFPVEHWDLLAMGDPMPDVRLARHQRLQYLSWMDFDTYTSTVRGADLGLSLMLSPHTSYPPLELAACGTPCVTTTWSVKSSERLAELSPHLRAVAPTREAIRDALIDGARVAASGAPSGPSLQAPHSWPDAFGAIEPSLERLQQECRLGDRLRCASVGAR